MQIYDEQTDKLLDKVEGILLRLAGEHGLVGANITRWRWDEPDITLVWIDSDVGKSLHVTVEQNGMGVEINAWKDFDVPGDRRRRKWRSEKFKPEPVPLKELEQVLKNSFQTLKGWCEGDLEEEAHII